MLSIALLTVFVSIVRSDFCPIIIDFNIRISFDHPVSNQFEFASHKSAFGVVTK